MGKTKIVTAFFLCFFFLGFLPGCGKADVSVENSSLNHRSWQIVSITPDDYNITYNVESGEDISIYPLDKLIAYYLGSDGAFSEGSSEELYQRFICAPETVIDYLCLIDDNDAQAQICKAISGANVYWHDSEEIYTDILQTLGQADANSEKAELISSLELFYKQAVSDDN